MHENSSKKSLDKCSFCGKKDDNEPFLENDNKTACICQNCAYMLANYEKTDSVDDSVVANKNVIFQDHLAALEDKWMEKNVINSYVLDAGGRINLVTFRFEEEGDDFYFVCELEVEDIDELPDDIEKKILDQIEWAFDEIRGDLESEGLDLEGYLGDKLLLNKVN